MNVKMRTMMMVGLAAMLLGSGCIVVEDDPYDNDPYSDQDDNNYEPPPPSSYEPYWVEVSCFATDAQSSTESLPDSFDFGPEQATGLPDTQDWNSPYCVDSPYAWSPQYENAGAEWLDVVFDVELRVDRVRIYENYGAGASDIVTLVNALSPELPRVEYGVPYDLQGSGQPCSVLSLDIDDPSSHNEFTDLPYDTVMLDLDTSISYGWNEIDAIELIGLFDDNSGPLPTSCEYL